MDGTGPQRRSGRVTLCLGACHVLKRSATAVPMDVCRFAATVVGRSMRTSGLRALITYIATSQGGRLCWGGRVNEEQEHFCDGEYVKAGRFRLVRGQQSTAVGCAALRRASKLAQWSELQNASCRHPSRSATMGARAGAVVEAWKTRKALTTGAGDGLVTGGGRGRGGSQSEGEAESGRAGWRAVPGIHAARGGVEHFSWARGSRGPWQGAHSIARVTVQSSTRRNQVQCCSPSHNKPLPPSPRPSPPSPSRVPSLSPFKPTRLASEGLRHLPAIQKLRNDGHHAHTTGAQELPQDHSPDHPRPQRRLQSMRLRPHVARTGQRRWFIRRQRRAQDRFILFAG